MTIKIGILASTKGSDMQAVIDEIEQGKLDAKICCVISNKRDNYALERARKHGIEAIFVDPNGKSREEFDGEIVAELEKRGVELVLLIGYMRILSKVFIDRFRDRAMNIHPSLLPMFAGGMDTDVHQQVLDRGVRVTGCTLHFINEEVDSGPIIIQKPVNVENDETADSLKQKVQEAEQEAILDGIRLFQQGRISVENSRVRILGP